MRLVVTADDTTGALETAAACADLGWHAVVRTTTSGATGPGDRPDDAPDGTSDDATGHEASLVVIDLRSRHLPADEAASRLRPLAQSAPSYRAHKIDSTLRGNWATELEAIAHAGRPVLVVPAFPAAGRTCVDGCVLVDGVPVHETAFARDPRSPVRSSRPAEQVHGASEVRDASGARTALADGVRLVVGDAADDAAIARYAALAAEHPELVLAGPAAVVSSLARQLHHVDRPAASLVAGSDPFGPVLVVSASQHPVAAAQLGELSARGIHVLRPPVDADPSDPDGVLAALAAAAHRHLADAPTATSTATDTRTTTATLVVVGGDTCAAVIGRADVEVEGTLGVGVAIGRTVVAGREVRLVTKPGGFGDADTLVRVLQDLIPR